MRALRQRASSVVPNIERCPGVPPIVCTGSRPKLDHGAVLEYMYTCPPTEYTSGLRPDKKHNKDLGDGCEATIKAPNLPIRWLLNDLAKSIWVGDSWTGLRMNRSDTASTLKLTAHSPPSTILITTSHTCVEECLCGPHGLIMY